MGDGWERRQLSRADLERWFDALIAAHGAALGRLASSYARGPGEREDLLQEIALAIWGALPRFRHECSERTFVFRIAHNRAIAHIARRRLPIVDGGEELEIEDPSPDPERALSSGQQGARLADAIHGLPLAYAQVVTLTLEGLSYGEIADVLGISETNVGARLTRARQMLRDLLRSPDGRS
jgi:RNA polymerase sigma-70 factor, ECF subfamily